MIKTVRESRPDPAYGSLGLSMEFLIFTRISEQLITTGTGTGSK